MLVSEFLTLIRSSEVKHLNANVKDDDPTMLGFLNLAILELHKEFKLLEQDAVITIAAGPEQNYTLDGTDVNVVMDLTDQEFICIEAIYNTYGQTLRIDDPVDTVGVKNPTFNTLYFKQDETVTNLVEGDVYTVAYRVAPAFLTATGDTIPLNIVFTEALIAYTAYKAHKSVRNNKGQGNTSQADDYLKDYKMAVADLHRTGVVPEDSLECNKFYQRGFV